MQAELRKIAAFLREKVKEVKKTKTIKCAQILCAATGLELLRRKIGIGGADV